LFLALLLLDSLLSEDDSIFVEDKLSLPTASLDFSFELILSSCGLLLSLLVAAAPAVDAAVLFS
jgi:hypothetical protein